MEMIKVYLGYMQDFINLDKIYSAIGRVEWEYTKEKGYCRVADCDTHALSDGASSDWMDFPTVILFLVNNSSISSNALP